MRSLAGAVLILLLPACIKQEPPAATSSSGTRSAPRPAAVASAAGSTQTNSTASSRVETQAQPLLATAAPPAAAAPASTPAAPAGPSGEPSAAAAATPSKEEGPAKDGAAIFTQICATCHMADGYGVPYLQPKIKGSAWISNPDPQPLLSLILRGSAILGEASKAYENDMAPQDHLSDAELAAVASYVRQRFASTPINEPVTPAQAALARSRPGLP